MKKTILSILLILTSSVLLAGCTQANSNTPSNPNNTNSNSTVEVDLEITANHLSFTPNIIEVKAGETVTVRVTSVDEVHDLVIDELNVDTGLIGGGESVVIEITAPQDASGKEFEFYCSVGSHRALGMVGKLRIL